MSEETETIGPSAARYRLASSRPIPITHALLLTERVHKALVEHWLADTGFHAPARFLADASVASGQPTWVYRFDHLTPAARAAGQPGAAHHDEVAYLFRPLALPRWPADDPVERTMQASMLDYWTRFARSGDPNGEGQPYWPRWQPGGDGVTQLLDVPVHGEAGVWKPRMQYHLGRYARLLEGAGL